MTIESVNGKIQLVAESVGHLDHELTQTRTDLREEIHRTAADTQAMIKFSHAELDWRLTTF